MPNRLDLRYLIPHLGMSPEEFVNSGALSRLSMPTLAALRRGNFISEKTHRLAVNARLSSPKTRQSQDPQETAQ